MTDEHLNFYVEYLSKPKLSIKNSFIFSNRCKLHSVNSIEKTGTILVLDIKKDPSPSINPNNQFFVITTLW